MKRWLTFLISFAFCISSFALPQPTDTLYTRVLSDMGFDYFKQGNLEAALDCYRKVCEVAPRLGDTVRWSAALSSMGAIYRRKQMPDSCLSCYQEALQLAEHMRDDAEQANLLSKIALNYMSAGEAKKAVSASERAVNLATQSGEMEAIMFASYAGSTVHFRSGSYEKGIRILQNLVTEAKRQDKPQYMLRGYRILLQMFDRRGLRDSVNHYMHDMDSALNILPSYAREVAMALEQQAIIYTKYHNFRKSLEAYQKLLSHQGGGNLTIDKIYLGMARNYYSLRDYLRAMKYYDRAVKTADSLHTVRLDEQVSNFNTRLEAKEKALAEGEKRQEELKQEIHFLRRTLYAMIALTGLIVAGLLWTKKRNARTEK